jgi:hypothetical protein
MESAGQKKNTTAGNNEVLSLQNTTARTDARVTDEDELVNTGSESFGAGSQWTAHRTGLIGSRSKATVDYEAKKLEFESRMSAARAASASVAASARAVMERAGMLGGADGTSRADYLSAVEVSSPPSFPRLQAGHAASEVVLESGQRAIQSREEAAIRLQARSIN